MDVKNFKYNKSWTKWIILIIVGLMLWSSYNKMVKGEQAVKRQWANVQSSYQRRADLIPNLVSTVKGYAEHENETSIEVTNARAKATSVNINPENLTPEAINQFQDAQAGLSSALGKLLVVVEKYPELKANQNFLELQAQLEGTENRINVERNRYNEEVEKFNARIKKFPANLFNIIFGFDEKGYFESKPGADVAPVVSFE